MIEAIVVMIEVFGVFIIAVCVALVSVCIYDFIVERKRNAKK
jgi:hypothetical protein